MVIIKTLAELFINTRSGEDYSQSNFGYTFFISKPIFDRQAALPATSSLKSEILPDVACFPFEPKLVGDLAILSLDIKKTSSR